ncbi:MAG: 50S ribosomal protein L25 [Chitinivibrionales bacterium]|nr:50S ribosomal protein L25 [Chitinivibrionales bacterium]
MRRFESSRPSHFYRIYDTKRTYKGGTSLNIEKLTARIRTYQGKSSARKSRESGWIPAVYYGNNRETKSIEVSVPEFGVLLRAGNVSHLIDLNLEGEKDSIAIVKEIQRDPIIPGHIFHLDFQHVSMDEKVTVEIPVEISGTPVGVKEQGGILGHPVKTITVECLPMNIPEKVVVDVSGLHIGESIHLSDLSVTDAEIKGSLQEMIANVTPPTKAKEEEAEAEEGAVEEGAAGGEAKEGGEAKTA